MVEPPFRSIGSRRSPLPSRVLVATGVSLLTADAAGVRPVRSTASDVFLPNFPGFLGEGRFSASAKGLRVKLSFLEPAVDCRSTNAEDLRDFLNISLVPKDEGFKLGPTFDTNFLAPVSKT